MLGLNVATTAGAFSSIFSFPPPLPNHPDPPRVHPPVCSSVRPSPFAHQLYTRAHSPLVSGPFQNAPPSSPLFRRTSYKALLFVLFAIALGFLALNVTAAVFMILAVFVALGGSYQHQRQNHAARAVGVMSKTLLGTQAGGLVVYVIAFAVVLGNSGDNEDETGSGF